MRSLKITFSHCQVLLQCVSGGRGEGRARLKTRESAVRYPGYSRSSKRGPYRSACVTGIDLTGPGIRTAGVVAMAARGWGPGPPVPTPGPAWPWSHLTPLVQSFSQRPAMSWENSFASTARLCPAVIPSMLTHKHIHRHTHTRQVLRRGPCVPEASNQELYKVLSPTPRRADSWNGSPRGNFIERLWNNYRSWKPGTIK